MNLKEAFRFQNKLQALMNEAENILRLDENITRTEKTCLRRKVMPGAQDETTVEQSPSEYSDRITEVAGFLVYLLEEKERLSAAVCRAKAGLDLPAGFDGEVGLNGSRQEVAALLRRMTGLRNSEVVVLNGGTGYRFNNEGNQVSYRCDVKKVVTINFDRNKIRRMCGDLSRKADEVSARLDGATVNTAVDYSEPFSVNDTFADAFELYLGGQATA